MLGNDKLITPEVTLRGQKVSLRQLVLVDVYEIRQTTHHLVRTCHQQLSVKFFKLLRELDHHTVPLCRMH